MSNPSTTPTPRPGPIRVRSLECHDDAATSPTIPPTATDRDAMYWIARARLVAAHAEEARCLALGALSLLAMEDITGDRDDREKALSILRAITEPCPLYDDISSSTQPAQRHI